MCCNPLSAAGSCSAPQPRSAEAKAAACDCAAHPLPRGVGTAQAPLSGLRPGEDKPGPCYDFRNLAAAQIDNGPSCKVLLRWYCGRS